MYLSNATYTFPLTIQSSSGGVGVSSISGALYFGTELQDTETTITGASGCYFLEVTFPWVTSRASFSIRVTAVFGGTAYSYSPFYGELYSNTGISRSNALLEYRPSTDPF